MMEKRVLKVGEGLYCPNEEASVVVSLLGKWQTVDGTEQVFDHRENTSIVIDEASDPLSQALEDAICSMKPGEECEVRVSMDETLTTCELLRGAPPDCLVTYTIHLASFKREPEVWTLSDLERQRRALLHKANGSLHFKKGNIYGASLHYSKALKYIISTDRELLTSQSGEYLTQRNALLLNLSACQLKLKQFASVTQNCTSVLQTGADVKALYRRGQALVAMNDFEGARKDFLEILKTEPTNTAAQKQLRELDTKERAHKNKYKKALKGMFN